MVMSESVTSVLKPRYAGRNIGLRLPETIDTSVATKAFDVSHIVQRFLPLQSKEAVFVPEAMLGHGDDMGA